jgi:hypothetical protein
MYNISPYNHKTVDLDIKVYEVAVHLETPEVNLKFLIDKYLKHMSLFWFNISIYCTYSYNHFDHFTNKEKTDNGKNKSKLSFELAIDCITNKTSSVRNKTIPMLLLRENI